MNRIAILLVFLLQFISCKDNNNEKMVAPSTGRFNELLVVISESDWDGEVGFALKEVLTREVLGLPQPEPQFSIIRIDFKMYDGLLKRTRNILVVKMGKENNFSIEKNLFSSPQVVINISGVSKENIINLIKENADQIINSYKQSDLVALRKKPSDPLIPNKDIRFFTKQGFEFNIPNNFDKVDDSDVFLWYRNETYNPGVDINGSMNIIAYTVPLNYPFEQVKDSISVIRNKIGKEQIPGPFENTYMITEAAYTPHVFDSRFGDLRAYKVLGKWEIKDAFMAGPFISYFVEDPINHRLIVAEGFVYAPSVNKRDYMFELEAIIGTIKLSKK